MKEIATNRILKAKIVLQYATQSDFAQKLDIKDSVVSRVVRDRKALSEKERLRWAEALGCKPEDVFDVIQ